MKWVEISTGFIRWFSIINLLVNLVFAKGGTFTMGCTSEQSNCKDDEKPTSHISHLTSDIGYQKAGSGARGAVTRT